MVLLPTLQRTAPSRDGPCLWWLHGVWGQEHTVVASMGLQVAQTRGEHPQAQRPCALATLEGAERCVVGTSGWGGGCPEVSR